MTKRRVPTRWKSMFTDLDCVPRRTKTLMLPGMLRAFAEIVRKHSSHTAADHMRLAADEIEEQGYRSHGVYDPSVGLRRKKRLREAALGYGAGALDALDARDESGWLT